MALKLAIIARCCVIPTKNSLDPATMLTQIVERFYSELVEVPVVKNSRQAAKITEIAGANLMIVCAAKG